MSDFDAAVSGNDVHEANDTDRASNIPVLRVQGVRQDSVREENRTASKPLHVFDEGRESGERSSRQIFIEMTIFETSDMRVELLEMRGRERCQCHVGALEDGVWTVD